MEIFGYIRNAVSPNAAAFGTARHACRLSTPPTAFCCPEQVSPLVLFTTAESAHCHTHCILLPGGARLRGRPAGPAWGPAPRVSRCRGTLRTEEQPGPARIPPTLAYAGGCDWFTPGLTPGYTPGYTPGLTPGLRLVYTRVYTRVYTSCFPVQSGPRGPLVLWSGMVLSQRGE